MLQSGSLYAAFSGIHHPAPGLHLAAPRTVNHELLGRSLDELAELCAGDRSDETIRLLRHLVPEYHEEQIKSRAAR